MHIVKQFRHSWIKMRARGAFSKRNIKMDETPVSKERSACENNLGQCLQDKYQLRSVVKSAVRLHLTVDERRSLDRPIYAKPLYAYSKLGKLAIRTRMQIIDVIQPPVEAPLMLLDCTVVHQLITLHQVGQKCSRFCIALLRLEGLRHVSHQRGKLQTVDGSDSARTLVMFTSASPIMLLAGVTHTGALHASRLHVLACTATGIRILGY
ncbi:hypothetical protein DBV15_07439 [Temnothorax longispinosus]|uniref:Uncharacterized protein n=1 Tax=Temnothorax longispinosus TaxID=300112 RepID=A0A4S2JDD0_9HYME|nr:hypothetical protein DBV15_07439 [Temnothorax longispinosus]